MNISWQTGYGKLLEPLFVTIKDNGMHALIRGYKAGSNHSCKTVLFSVLNICGQYHKIMSSASSLLHANWCTEYILQYYINVFSNIKLNIEEQTLSIFLEKEVN